MRRLDMCKGNTLEKRIFMLDHSMGGSYTIWYAANHPNSLDARALWQKIQSGKVNLYEALFANINLDRNYILQVGRKCAGSSDFVGRVDSVCSKCGNKILCDIYAVSKIKHGMPERIPVEVWRGLPPPPREIIAKALVDLGGLVEYC